MAASRLTASWQGALPIRGLPAGRPNGGKAGGACLDDDQWKAAQEAWDDYRGAMDEVERRCSVRHAAVVRAVIIHEEQGVFWMVREALTCLADWWGVR